MALLLVSLLVACSDDPITDVPRDQPPQGPLAECDLNSRYVADTELGRDGIPALIDPPMAHAGDAGLSYLAPDDRVLGFVVGGQAYAVPHNILWWHEIVNLEVAGRRLALTLAPLTGSALGFDRSSIDGQELRHSGYLYRANIVFYNRGTPESHWPQMLAEARCGEISGQDLARWPVIDLRWGSWKELHPTTLAVTENTGHDRDYLRYPYGDYDRPTNPDFLGYPMPDVDPRRPPKELVVGVPPEEDEVGIAFPHTDLEDRDGPFAVVGFTWTEEPAILLWSDAARGGMAYRPRTAEGTAVTLTTDGAGIRDQETGSRWTVDGRAVEGELSGSTLVPIQSAFTAFWGAWSAFFPQTVLWGAGI